MGSSEHPEIRASFVVKNRLAPAVWKADRTLRPAVKAQLDLIAQNVLTSLALGVEPEDILLTGSAANFNWSAESDLDLHILFDLDKLVGDGGLDKEVVYGLLLSVCGNWNNQHDIRIRGFEVELFFSDAAQELPSDAGAYSLMRSAWVQEPQGFEKQMPLTPEAEAQAKAWAKQIEGLEQRDDAGEDPTAIYTDTRALRAELRAARQGSLESGGELGSANIAFKWLRRSGHLQRLATVSTKAYDRMLGSEQLVGDPVLDTTTTDTNTGSV